MDESYLAHYGVLGMKWGVRHDPKKAYTRATKKYDRLKKKSDRKTYKAKKAAAHTPSRLLRITDLGTSYYDYKIRNLNSKNARAAKAQLKAERWMHHMQKEFSKVPVDSLDGIDTSWLYR